MTVVTRFAPSPTGYLHLGHAFSVWAVEAMAQAINARLLLRIEDIDKTRCRPKYEMALRDDLKWLGIEFADPIIRQSERMHLYSQAASHLKKMGLLYPCTCTRKKVLAESPGPSPDGPLYSGRCRLRGPEEGLPLAWRLDMEKALAKVGELRLDPSSWGDLILVRKEITTSYHLSVVVDDADQGITHIMRGKDLLAATAVHELLQRLLKLHTPIYAYHDLIVHDNGRKYSKSKRAPSIQELRTQGLSPKDLRARLNDIPKLSGKIDAIKSGDFL